MKKTVCSPIPSNNVMLFCSMLPPQVLVVESLTHLLKNHQIVTFMVMAYLIKWLRFKNIRKVAEMLPVPYNNLGV